MSASPRLRARNASSSNSCVASAHGHAVDRDLAPLGVDDDAVIELDRRARALGTGPPQDRSDAGDELVGREGLDDVVVGADLEPDDAIDLVVAGGQEQHGDVRALPEPTADLEAVEVGQADVEHGEHRVVLLDELQRPLSRSPARSGRNPSLRRYMSRSPAIATSSSTTTTTGSFTAPS